MDAHATPSILDPDTGSNGRHMIRRCPDVATTAHDRPLFFAEWLDVVFIHFELEPRVLQSSVPFDLDLRDGRAYVSLVAFTQRRLRPAFGGRLAALFAAPLADHAFLNVRTYVRHGGE